MLQELGFSFPIYYNTNECYNDIDFTEAVPFSSKEIDYLKKQISSSHLRFHDKPDKIVISYNERKKTGLSIESWYNEVRLYVETDFEKNSSHYNFIKHNIYKFKISGLDFGSWVQLINELESEIQDEITIRELSKKLGASIESNERRNHFKYEGRCAPGEDAFWREWYSGGYTDLGGF